jgi:hypothetical protein
MIVLNYFYAKYIIIYTDKNGDTFTNLRIILEEENKQCGRSILYFFSLCRSNLIEKTDENP